MKPKALLIAKETSDSNADIAEATSQAGFFLLRANEAKDAFERFRKGAPEIGSAEIDLVILDVDPGIHGMAILEALTARDNSPPVIVVTGLEQSEMAPIARRHGAAACIGKPFSAAELLARIEEVCPAEDPSSSCNCDAWGHPVPRRHKSAGHKCSGDCGGSGSGEEKMVAPAARVTSTATAPGAF